MVVAKFFVKILLLPCWLALTVLIWFGLFVTSFSSVLIWLLSGLFFLVAVFSWIAALATGAEAMQMLMIGFVAFALPLVAVKALTIVDALRSWGGLHPVLISIIQYDFENRLPTMVGDFCLYGLEKI